MHSRLGRLEEETRSLNATCGIYIYTHTHECIYDSALFWTENRFSVMPDKKITIYTSEDNRGKDSSVVDS